jgi:hypothetical protein
MNNPEYLAQVGHTLGGCLAIVTAALFGGMHAVWIALPIVAAAAAIKEFWYDATYELPKQTFKDNLIDFLFYELGSLVGLGIAALKFYVVSSSS